MYTYKQYIYVKQIVQRAAALNNIKLQQKMKFFMLSK